MTAVVEVDDPLVEQIARRRAEQHAKDWGYCETLQEDVGAYIDSETRRLMPEVRATIEALKDMGRLLPEGVTRREVHSRFDGKVREVLEDSPVFGRLGRPVLAENWWIERRTVWETPWASVETPAT